MSQGADLQIEKNWYQTFLQARGLDKPNGQMLFQYRASLAEYLELRELFKARIDTLRGAPWRFESSIECALFVLYTSEWWRREYDGGAWRWTSIFQSLTSGPYRVEPSERSVGIAWGLRMWGHRPSEDGKKFLGAIVAQGGLPLKLVARGDGITSRLLLSATRKAQLLGWGDQHLVDFFESHADDLVQHLRAAEIYRLLAAMVTTVLTLRSEYKLAGVGNPVASLDHAEPKWRERFPISVDDRSVEPLLVGMVSEVSRQTKSSTIYPISLFRTLVKRADSDGYVLAMEIQVPSSISLEALASAMGVAPSKLPTSFVLEIVGDQRVPLAQGRQLLGSSTSSIILTGKSRRILGMEACKEILIALRSVGADIVAPSSIPGGEALDESQPWCFSDATETLTLIGIGSCKVNSGSAFVLLPEKFTYISSEDGEFKFIGIVEGLLTSRSLYRVVGAVDIVMDGEIYNVSTKAQSCGDTQLIWKGQRHWCHSTPYPVFQGVPRLYRTDLEGQLNVVPDRDIEWVQAVRKGAPLGNLKGHRGPADAWLLADGKRQRRFRMVLVASDASISFKSGANECEASIEFHGWGLHFLNADEALIPNSTIEGFGSLFLKAQNKPPSVVRVTTGWAPGLPILQIDLPFPSNGGRFARSDGVILANGASIPIKKIYDIKLQVFDKNPSTPKKYRLEIKLEGDSKNSRLGVQAIDVPLDMNGIGEIRFFEIQTILNNLFCQSDELDARLEVILFSGATAIRKLTLSRYDFELELDMELRSLVAPGSILNSDMLDQHQQMELHAIPLLERTPSAHLLEKSSSNEDLETRWSLAQLPEGHSPWLIYPTKDSTSQARPLLWVTSPFDKLATLEGLVSTPCMLATAMSNADSAARNRELKRAISEMTDDQEHASWALVTSQYQHLKHLPLTTLDYWRVIARNQDACLAAILKFPTDLHVLMNRFRDELGVVWELTSWSSLVKAYEIFSDSLARQMSSIASPDLLNQLTIKVFTEIGQISDSLAMQVDRLLFMKVGFKGARFDRLVAESTQDSDVLLQQLWNGQDSFLQRILLRNHADERLWPRSQVWEELIAAIEQLGETSHVSFFRSLGPKVLWMPRTTSGGADVVVKLDVANAPLLAGYLIQICDAKKWLQSNDHIASLRQIRAFDPTWFDLGIHMGSQLAIKSSAQVPSAARRVVSTGGDKRTKFSGGL